jgi:hypothetical protein
MALSLGAQVNVTTQHNDIGRTGQNTAEVILTPENVSSGSFGKLFSVPVDGEVFAQPLYLSGINIPGLGTHNVVFIATEHDSIYALDADTQMAPLWQVTLLDAAHGAQPEAIPEPSSDIGCTNIAPEYGVTGTPVIDASTGTLYVVSVSSESGYPVQRLHALDVTTGAEKYGAPVTLAASVPGSGTGSSNGVMAFDPKWTLQRAGLLLVNNNVYAAFGSHCDFSPYHGWLLGYNETTLKQTAAFVTTPNGIGGGTWMGGAGLSADTTSAYPRIFMPTGNGTYDATLPLGTNNMDYADDLIQLTLNNGVTVTDFFTPYNQSTFAQYDVDVSSGGVLILPNQSGPYPHLAVQLGKSGNVYLLNRDNLGGFNSASNKIVQEVDGQISGLWGMPAYWNGNLYFWTAGFPLTQFTISNGVISATPVAKGSYTSLSLGITPSISSNGNSNAILWTIDSGSNPEVLAAYDATNVATTLYSSATNPTRDIAGAAAKFSVPTIANGKVYVIASGQISVYGLTPPADFTLTAPPGPLSVSQNASASLGLSITSLFGFNSSVSLSASGLPSGVSSSFSAASSSSPTLTFSASPSAAAGTYPITVTAAAPGGLVHSVVFNLQVLSNTQPDFSLTAMPAAINLSPGAIAVNGIVLAQLHGFNVTPLFSVSGLPTGVTATVSTVSGTYYVLSLFAAADAPTVPATVTVTGTSGRLARSVAFSLQVAPSPSLTAVQLIANNSSKCLGVSSGSFTPGAAVVQSTCTSDPGQVWDLDPLSGDTYKIISANSGLALSSMGGSTAPGSLIVQNTYAAAIGQQWLIQNTPWGFSYILDANAQQCLDVEGASTADGAAIDQTGCTGAGNQLWSIVPAHTTTQVNLSPFFNNYAIVTDGTQVDAGGLGLGYALSESTLGPTASWNEYPFTFGPVNFQNAVSSATVTLPAGNFSSLQFLALAVYGNQINQQLQVTYTDGTTAAVSQSFSDWGSPTNFAGESQAIQMPYRVGPTGAGSLGPWYVYGYSLPLNNAKTVRSVQLPANPDIYVLAMTLVK